MALWLLGLGTGNTTNQPTKETKENKTNKTKQRIQQTLLIIESVLKSQAISRLSRNNNYMIHDPSWEADSSSASLEIHGIMWNTKLHYPVHKSPPLIRMLSHINPFHVFPNYLLKIHLNIILPSKPSSSKRYISLRFPHQNPVCNSPPAIRVMCPANLIPLDFTIRIIFWWGVQIMNLVTMHSPSTPLTPKHIPQYTIL